MQGGGPAGINMWDTQDLSPLPNFFECKEAIPIPFTTKIYTCSTCSGSKQEKCGALDPYCMGKMTKCDAPKRKNAKNQQFNCNQNDGTGKYCTKCKGTGNINCPKCLGSTKVPCKACKAEGELWSTECMFRLHFTLVDFKVVKGDISNEDLPDAEVIRISETKGKSIFEKTCDKVAAPAGYGTVVDAACA